MSFASKSEMRRLFTQRGLDCAECGCYKGMHGGCKSRGHGPDCHGIHTMYFCSCDCCPCEDSTKIQEVT